MPKLGLLTGDDGKLRLGLLPEQLEAPAPAAPAPAAPADPQSALVSYLREKMQMPAGLDLAGLRQAQQQDLAREPMFALGRAGEKALSLMQGRAPDYTGIEPNQNLGFRQWLAQRQVAQEDAQRNYQMGMLEPTVRKAMGDAASAEADAPKKRSETAATLAGIPKTDAEARLANANAKGAELENGPASPAMLGVARQYGVALPTNTTQKQARELIDAKAKQAGMQIDWSRLGLEAKRVGLEGRRLDVEEKHYQSDHPLEPVAGERYVGPGAPPPRDSEVVKELGNRKASTQALKATLDEMKAIYARAGRDGRVVGADAQRLATLRGKLSGAIGRNASGGRLAEYDVELANQQLPDPTSLNPFSGGVWHQDRMNAALDELGRMAEVDLDAHRRTNHFAPVAEAMAAANDRLIKAGVQDRAQRAAILHEMGY